MLPYQRAPAALVGPELRAACARAIHVLTPEGETLKSGRGVLYILDRLGYRRAATIGRLPPFVWGVELGYAIVARHRRFFGRFLFTKE